MSIQTVTEESDKMKELTKWHWGAFALHAANLVGSIAFVLSDTSKGYWSLSLNSFGRRQFRTDYYVAWVIPFFFFLSSVSHLYQALMVKDGKRPGGGPPGTNAARWFEYALSASPMFWLGANLSGIEDPTHLGALVLLNPLLQYSGYVTEMRLANDDPTKAKDVTVFGWAIHLIMWLPVFFNFFIALSTSSDGVPTLVYVIVPVLFLQFTAFGIPLELWRIGRIKNYFTVEKVYIILSLTAKMTLGWMYLGGAMRERDADQR